MPMSTTKRVVIKIYEGSLPGLLAHWTFVDATNVRALPAHSLQLDCSFDCYRELLLTNSVHLQSFFLQYALMAVSACPV